MPKRLTVEFTCDRCGAVWSEDYESGSPIPETASINICLRQQGADGEPVDQVVSLEVLCDKCSSTVGAYVKSINLDPDARKKSRAKKGEEDVEEESASPLPPPAPATTPRYVEIAPLRPQSYT